MRRFIRFSVILGVIAANVYSLVTMIWATMALGNGKVVTMLGTKFYAANYNDVMATVMMTGVGIAATLGSIVGVIMILSIKPATRS